MSDNLEIFCPECGVKWPKDYKYCVRCGHKLPDIEKIMKEAGGGK